MAFAYLAFFESSDDGDLAISEADLATVAAIIKTTPGLASANLYTPETTNDMYNKVERSPVLGLQLYFDQLTTLESAIGPSGHLQQLAAFDVLTSIRGTKATQQAMYVRPFPVDDGKLRTGDGQLPCSYVVHYPGPAVDMNAWLHHYVSHHPQVMRTFPDIRQIEVLSRVDWCGFLPWERVNHMQRNRVMFDNPVALQTALQSPARVAMREDFKTLPPFEGGNSHFPMATRIIVP
ncbi:hypothetical protein [Rhizobium lusitanum]|jgi:hypothetical protein|uniref:EthD domain-containing protein n=1 Tax=Rhizobium lusitanum TaxID=293958 RepID=A0A1C3WQS1_9HYPH|nr:hypothetical protein [Rhizobium lusitanum]SCB42412.1 hypothetical protein GA0061101_115104 [Rhizobium lusitanum]